MSSSNCCFLTCMQVSQEAGQAVWYSHLFKNFQQFIVIHTVKGFGIVNKAEIDVFLELSCFFDDLADVGNLISGSSTFSKTSLKIFFVQFFCVFFPPLLNIFCFSYKNNPLINLPSNKCTKMCTTYVKNSIKAGREVKHFKCKESCAAYVPI